MVRAACVNVSVLIHKLGKRIQPVGVGTVLRDNDVGVKGPDDIGNDVVKTVEPIIRTGRSYERNVYRCSFGASLTGFIDVTGAGKQSLWIFMNRNGQDVGIVIKTKL